MRKTLSKRQAHGNRMNTLQQHLKTLGSELHVIYHTVCDAQTVPFVTSDSDKAVEMLFRDCKVNDNRRF